MGGYLSILNSWKGWNSWNGFEVGTVVTIKFCHPLTIKRMQSICGGWKPEMVECIKGSSTVVSSHWGYATVRAKSGNVYFLNANLLTNYDAGADPLSLQIQNLFLNIKLGNLTNVEIFLDILGTEETLHSCTPLIYAVTTGQLEIVKLFIEKMADINATDANGTTPLHKAVSVKNFDICKVLLENGADINKQNKDWLTPLMLAVKSKQQGIVNLLARRRNIDLNIGDYGNDTALHLASQLSDFESVETLLSSGANAEKVNKMKLTAFHCAAITGNEKIIEAFLEWKPAIVDLQDTNKFTCVHIAALKNHVNCLQTLIGYQADINIQNIILQTPLHIALEQKNLKCVEILIDNGADLNKKDIKGNTPLHNAMIYFMKDENMRSFLGIRSEFPSPERPEEFGIIITNMVQRGARLDIENSLGLTPADLCLDYSLKNKLIGMDEEEQEVHMANQRRDIEEIKCIIRQMDICVNCNIRKMIILFQCNHMACYECARDKVDCFICGVPIQQKYEVLYNY